MKKILFCIIFAFVLFISPNPVFANDANWIIDDNVTLAAKNTSRFGMLFDWSIKNYNWICVVKLANETCDNTKNPLQKLWAEFVIYVVTPVLILGILILAITLIVTHGTNMTIMKLAPKYIIALIFISLSFPILQFLYQSTDMIQGFFLRTGFYLRHQTNSCPPDCLNQTDLINVAWNYNTIVALRSPDPADNEQTLMSTILIEATGITYLIISIILMIRKIVLWFFIIISPIVPFFFLFSPGRNVAKSWTNIFIKWLFYAPFFAVFLKSAAYLFRHFPLPFSNPDLSNPGQITFPTSISIFLGINNAPSQANIPNLTETFAMYFFALITLWIIIILPLLLMKHTVSLNDNSLLIKGLTMVNMNLRSYYFKTITQATAEPRSDVTATPTPPFVKKPPLIIK